MYNPIPIGSVIISTTKTISVLKPIEYGAADEIKIIFTVVSNMTIVSTIYEPTLRDLYIIYFNQTNSMFSTVQLVSVEKLGQVTYQLPISFGALDIDKLPSFTSDVVNRRIFLTNKSGDVTLLSMSGSMKTILPYPSTITEPIRSVNYNNVYNRLFIITDSTVNSCTGLDNNQLQCCQAPPKAYRLRSITFDSSSKSLVYVVDESSGIYEVVLNESACPIALRPIDKFSNYKYSDFVIHQGLYFSSGNLNDESLNSKLIIGNRVKIRRTISFDFPIIALHLSHPNVESKLRNANTCFHGITYYDYRVAVVLAAIFGTVMGIFMCFNALFCIDFFMTKRIIQDLKSQIPHNSLEDRWNKLVEEKYAKLALEIHRKKNDPPVKPKLSNDFSSSLINDSIQRINQSVNPIPKISAYFRRKSEIYLNRHRNDDYQTGSTRYTMATNQSSHVTIPEIKEQENYQQQNEKDKDQMNSAQIQGEFL